MFVTTHHYTGDALPLQSCKVERFDGYSWTLKFISRKKPHLKNFYKRHLRHVRQLKRRAKLDIEVPRNYHVILNPQHLSLFRFLDLSWMISHFSATRNLTLLQYALVIICENVPWLLLFLCTVVDRFDDHTSPPHPFAPVMSEPWDLPLPNVFLHRIHCGNLHAIQFKVIQSVRLPRLTEIPVRSSPVGIRISSASHLSHLFDFPYVNASALLDLPHLHKVLSLVCRKTWCMSP